MGLDAEGKKFQLVCRLHDFLKEPDTAAAQPQVFDLTANDGTEHFHIGDSSEVLDVPQLSFMQFAELGEEGRRDLVVGAVGRKRAAINFDDSEAKDFGDAISVDEDDLGQSLFHEAERVGCPGCNACSQAGSCRCSPRNASYEEAHRRQYPCL